MTTTANTPTPTTGRRDRVPLRTVGRGTLISLGLALVATIAVYLVGDVGAPVRVPTGSGSEVDDLALAAVVGAAVLWLLVGGLGLALLDRLRGDGFVPWVVLAGVISVASVVPVVGFDVATDSQVTVVVLHVAVGAAAVVGHALARRRTA